MFLYPYVGVCVQHVGLHLWCDMLQCIVQELLHILLTLSEVQGPERGRGSDVVMAVMPRMSGQASWHLRSCPKMLHLPVHLLVHLPKLLRMLHERVPRHPN